MNNDNQTSLEFDAEIPQKPARQRLVFGGIYINKDDTLDEIYDGMFGICFGGDSFCFLMDEMDHIENEVEIGSAHNMKIVHGYGLAFNKLKKEWYIRNSSIKHSDAYIIAKGRYNEGFEQSLRKYMKILMK